MRQIQTHSGIVVSIGIRRLRTFTYGMRGVIIDLNTTGDYKYKTSRTAWQWFIFSGFDYFYTTQNVLREELATVGLKYNNRDDITENMIRKEHGLNLRGAY